MNNYCPPTYEIQKQVGLILHHAHMQHGNNYQLWDSGGPSHSANERPQCIFQKLWCPGGYDVKSGMWNGIWNAFSLPLTS